MTSKVAQHHHSDVLESTSSRSFSLSSHTPSHSQKMSEKYVVEPEVPYYISNITV